MDAPADLPPERAAAWTVLDAGGSYLEAAAAAGRATGTISKWVAGWRATHGADLFRRPRQLVAAEQTALARQQVEQTWADLRVREARNAGVTASQIRARLLELLPTVATVRVDRGPGGASEPVLVHGPDARQIKALADAAARLLEVAELLDNRPTRHSRRSVPSDQWVGAPGTGPTPAEKLATVLDLAAAIRNRAAS